MAGIALADAVPSGEGEGTAEGPHDGDGRFGGVCEGRELEHGSWGLCGCRGKDVLGRSACAAISIMRAALLEELEELKRTAAGVTRLAAKAAEIGARVAMRANMIEFIGVLFCWFW